MNIYIYSLYIYNEYIYIYIHYIYTHIILYDIYIHILYCMIYIYTLYCMIYIYTHYIVWYIYIYILYCMIYIYIYTLYCMIYIYIHILYCMVYIYIHIILYDIYIHILYCMVYIYIHIILYDIYIHTYYIVWYIYTHYIVWYIYIYVYYMCVCWFLLASLRCKNCSDLGAWVCCPSIPVWGTLRSFRQRSLHDWSIHLISPCGDHSGHLARPQLVKPAVTCIESQSHRNLCDLLRWLLDLQGDVTNSRLVTPVLLQTSCQRWGIEGECGPINITFTRLDLQWLRCWGSRQFV